MLDIKRIRENLEDIKKAMDRRGEKEFDLDAVVALDDKRRELLKEVEVMKNELNVESKKIPQLIKEGKDVDAAKAQLKELSDKIKAIDEQVRTVEGEMEYNLMRIPNVPHPDVPQGTTDEDNVEIRQWGETPKFDFEGKAHWDIGTGLGILDFETAGKITGSRFTLYKGLGARLERAIINFFLNTHTEEHGYTEVLPPFMANRTSFIGTGQLPKFEEDMFKIEGMEYFLIPTAEVPVTNIHRDEILTADQLPIKYCAYTPCFRSEAGSAGRDTRGLVRQHQFNKVELVNVIFAKLLFECILKPQIYYIPEYGLVFFNIQQLKRLARLVSAEIKLRRYAVFRIFRGVALAGICKAVVRAAFNIVG